MENPSTASAAANSSSSSGSSAGTSSVSANVNANARRAAEFQVVIIVSCEDNRLSPLTDTVPKCLLPLANRCLLFYQLEVLEKSGATDVFLVAQDEYHPQLSAKVNTFVFAHLVVEIIPVSAAHLNGSADGLRVVKDKIRGDFVCIASDCLFACPLGPLVKYHRRNANDVTVVLTGVPIDEPDKKGGIAKIRVEKEDQEIIGICTDDNRIVYKQSVMELEYTSEGNKVELTKNMLNKCTSMTLRNDCVDVEVYVFSHWILDMLAHPKNRRLVDLKTDVLPFLVNRQFQPESYVFANVSGIESRRRNLTAVEKWYTNSRINSRTGVTAATGSSRTGDGNVAELCDYVADCVFGDQARSDTARTHLDSSNSINGNDSNNNNSNHDPHNSSDNSMLNTSGDSGSGLLGNTGYHTEEAVDLIRVFGCLFEHPSSGRPATPAQLLTAGSQQVHPQTPFFGRLTQLPTYVSLNRCVVSHDGEYTLFGH
jgi:translation initiation factor eIF-2B subunit gamma